MPPGKSAFEDMMETWFPGDSHPPYAYLIDTSEEALLLPDWLKLRMIRSANQRLVDAGKYFMLKIIPFYIYISSDSI